MIVAGLFLIFVVIAIKPNGFTCFTDVGRSFVTSKTLGFSIHLLCLNWNENKSGWVGNKCVEETEISDVLHGRCLCIGEYTAVYESEVYEVLLCEVKWVTLWSLLILACGCSSASSSSLVLCITSTYSILPGGPNSGSGTSGLSSLLSAQYLFNFSLLGCRGRSAGPL